LSEDWPEPEKPIGKKRGVKSVRRAGEKKNQAVKENGLVGLKSWRTNVREQYGRGHRRISALKT